MLEMEYSAGGRLPLAVVHCTIPPPDPAGAGRGLQRRSSVAGPRQTPAASSVSECTLASSGLAARCRGATAALQSPRSTVIGRLLSDVTFSSEGGGSPGGNGGVTEKGQGMSGDLPAGLHLRKCYFGVSMCVILLHW